MRPEINLPKLTDSQKSSYEQRLGTLLNQIKFERANSMERAEHRVEAYWLQLALGERSLSETRSKINLFLNRFQEKNPLDYDEFMKFDPKKNIPSKPIQIRDRVFPLGWDFSRR
ncbi:hypothetical protein HY389_00970 [Candidatus Daviesbacteria bacterium]|nr:hypothetical protein [Candidatus Daviesbacteria bacterium]